MARAQYADVVMYVDAGVFKPANNARVSVYAPGTSTLQTIYTTRSAGATKSNPFTTDASGAAEFWAEWGDYDIKLEDLEVPARFGTKTIGWQSTNGEIGAIPSNRIAGDGGLNFSALNALTLRQFSPIGAITEWWRPSSGHAVPSGWVICNGQSLTAAQHEFTGGGTIAVPDLRNAFILGADSGKSDGTAGVLGSNSAGDAPGIRGTGGSNNTNLQHSHGINGDGAHGHTVDNHAHHLEIYSMGENIPGGGGGYFSLIGGDGTFYHQHFVKGDTWGSAPGTSAVGNHSHGGATTNGLSTTQATQPRYVGLLYIMKVKRD